MLAAYAIRQARPEEASRLLEVRVAVRENSASMETLAVHGIDACSVEADLRGDCQAWVVEARADQIAGFALACRSDGCLRSLFVRPEFEGRGIGQILLDAACIWLAEAGCAKAWLETGVDPLLRAHRFYRRAGWRRDGQIELRERYCKELVPLL
jgi:GNAT superfamily N-acetyltransferase